MVHLVEERQGGAEEAVLQEAGVQGGEEGGVGGGGGGAGAQQGEAVQQDGGGEQRGGGGARVPAVEQPGEHQRVGQVHHKPGPRAGVAAERGGQADQRLPVVAAGGLVQPAGQEECHALEWDRR